MDRGSILLYKNLPFENGITGDNKYLIILNTPKNVSESYLCCKPTSKKQHNIDNQGCYSSKNIYVLNASQDFFPLKTWVQFHRFWEIKVDDILFNNRNVQKVGQLKTQTINAIINCVKKSDDISSYQSSLL